MDLYCLASASKPGGPSYVLLDLPEPLLRAYEQGHLVLKSDSTSGKVLACTDSQSYALALAPQNPTSMLCLPAPEPSVGPEAAQCRALVAGVVEKRLEPRLTAPSVDWSGLAVFESEAGCTPQLRGPRISLEQASASAMCSDAEFKTLWRMQPCAVLDGCAAKLGPTVVADTAADIVTALVAEGHHDGQLEWELARSVLNLRQRNEVLEAVYARFWDSALHRLDFEAIALYIGRQKLRQLGSRPQLEAQFLLEWSRELPVHNLKYSMDSLAGHFVRLPGNQIRSLEARELPAQPKQRLERLLSIKSAWPLDEMTPFLRDIAPNNIKLDAWLKRYARIQDCKTDKIVRARRG